VNSGTIFLLAPDLGIVDITLGTAGTLDAVVDWRSSTDDLDIALVRGQCTAAAALSGACVANTLAQAAGFSKPERVSVPNLPAGTYTLLIVNNGPSSESASWEIGVTR
jgi:hypothetical protein